MRKQLTILTFFLISCIISTAQDLNFSQFYEQPLLRNPALSGLFKGDLRVSGAFRDQWGSITVPFRTTAMSMEYKMKANSAEDVITIGSQLAVDAAGDIRLKRTSFLPSLNFHKSLSGERNEYLSMAFMGGLVSSQFDASKMKLGDQFRNGSYDPTNPTAQQVVATGYQYWDAAAGLCYSNSMNNGGNFYILVLIRLLATKQGLHYSPIIINKGPINKFLAAPCLDWILAAKAMNLMPSMLVAFYALAMH